ncbi:MULTISPECIES: AlpA family phage regulatory protein [Salinivibrio]|uniref:AlpA family phage regulatory protein n=1 Tax=Salinivibrio TaxID=51366 RepID=UPI00098863D6|nr:MULTISPECIES: AlpA family phage regulatory protein [Salinivibrio]OOE46286.1 transcriptional regulator [Salinivibrio kushneri]OOE48057.1 transcriptional regulator [Salinivibrio kushneri]OOE74278.1 transcriptional regulator [Salinivibrio sp. ML290]
MKLLKLQQVMEKTSLCSSSIYNLMKEGDFPKNISVMGKRKAWLESEVEEWMMAKIAERDSTVDV